MIIDKDEIIELSASLSQDLPSPDFGVISKEKYGDFEIRLIRNGKAQGENSVKAVMWASCALKNGKYVCSVALEALDLRILSSFTGISCKTLQEEYGTKGFLGGMEIVVFGNGEVEELGYYGGDKTEEGIKAYLMESILDSLDIEED